MNSAVAAIMGGPAPADPTILSNCHL